MVGEGRPSTTFWWNRKEDVDGRDKRDHDDRVERVNSEALERCRRA
jgi:hypothetical protein